MIDYNAKDLIEQAQMLADLQNSDFISWKENIMFLDNAWTELYQQIINHGDKSFLKTLEFEGDRCELPCDFYQLHYICFSDGLSKRPINRKSKTSTNEGPYYDIVGNEIVIYNKMNSLRSIEVQYYPVRDTITFAADDVKVEGINGQVIDVCDKKVLYKESSGYYYVKDIINNRIEKVTEGFLLADSGVVNNKSMQCFKMDNKAYFATYDTGEFIIKKMNGTEVRRVKIEHVPGIPFGTVNALTDCAAFFYYGIGRLRRFDLETGVTEDYADGLVSKRVYSFNNNVYYETTEGIWCNHELLIPSREYDRFHGVMKVDSRTGYGILVDDLTIKSAYGNTELLFPNNVYYTFMAYKLAAYYKIKQNQDPTGVSALGADALKTFYDTLPRDENEYVRISNVYAR